MLVLSRKERESIVIRTPNEVITVSIDSIKGKAVRIGVEAPTHVGVWRKEIDDSIHGKSLPVGDGAPKRHGA